MIRYLLERQFGLCFAVLFIAVMVVLGSIVFPYIVDTYGHAGFFVGLAAIFATGLLVSRRP